jgi:hypothetical protein
MLLLQTYNPQERAGLASFALSWAYFFGLPIIYSYLKAIVSWDGLEKQRY